MSDVTRIQTQIESGNPAAAEQLLPLVYDELRKLAAAKLAQEQPGQSVCSLNALSPPRRVLCECPWLAGSPGGILTLVATSVADNVSLHRASLWHPPKNRWLLVFALS